MSNLNYNNYIYLTIDPYDISLGRDYGTLKSQLGEDFHVVDDLSPDTIPRAITYLEQNGVNISYQAFNVLPGKNGDYPNFNVNYTSPPIDGLGVDLSQVRIQQPTAEMLGGAGINVFESIGGQNTFFKITNDFAAPPGEKLRFVLSDDKVKFLGKSSLESTTGGFYYYISPTSYTGEPSDNIVSNTKQASKILASTVPGVPGLLFEFRRAKRNANGEVYENGIIFVGTKSPLIPIDAADRNNFKFTQKSYLVVKLPNALIGSNVPNSAIIEQFIKPFFNKLISDARGDFYGGYMMDCSTRIGVPYDYKTVIDENAYEKAAGVVKTGQPTYENVYNYYDPQYEPTIIDVLEVGTISERSLPSIYDFLYFPVQKKYIEPFLGLPSNYNLSLDNINFSNLNSYLDAFSKLIKRYSNTSLLFLTPNRVLEEFAPDGFTDNNFINNPRDSFLFTDKSNLYKLLSLADTSDGIEHPLVSPKNNTIPSWQESLKSGIYFSEKSLEYFNQARNYETTFPFYFKINIPVEDRGPLAKLLSESDILDAINTHAAAISVPNYGVDDQISTVGNFYGGLINGYTPDHFNLYNRLKLKTFNLHFDNSLGDVLPTDQYPEGSPQPGQGSTLNSQPPDYYTCDLTLDDFYGTAPKNVFVYTDKDIFQETSENAFLDLINYAKSLSAMKKLRDLLDDADFFRSPKDIQDGKLAHQETLMYEIVKYKLEDGKQKFVQNMFLPITLQNNLTYYDTQVQPYKTYFYKIFAHKAIVGTKYRPAQFEMEVLFEGNNTIDSTNVLENDIISFDYEVEPYIKFVRVPYYNTEMVNISTDFINYSIIEDLPPLPPQVKVIPFRNINNKILFLLGNSSGQMKAKHQSIFNTDDAEFIQTYASQGLDFTKDDALLTFGGDDIAGVFEVFRTKKLPNKYKDIQNDSTLVQKEIDARSPSLIDDISPNVDYYYTFRTRDIHGKLSNPTDFYKVRMVQEPGIACYLKVQLINLADANFEQAKQTINYSKSFKKYLRLKVAENKSLPVANPEIQLDDQGFAIGDYQNQNIEIKNTEGNVSKYPVFGGKYKMRLSSKQTGRKIDINFTVKEPENIINEI